MPPLHASRDRPRHRGALLTALLLLGCGRGAAPSAGDAGAPPASSGAAAPSGSALAAPGAAAWGRAGAAAPAGGVASAAPSASASARPVQRAGPVRADELGATPELRPPGAFACRLEGDPKRAIELRATAASEPFARVSGALTVTVARSDADPVVSVERAGVRLHGLAPRAHRVAGGTALWLHVTRALELGPWWPGPRSHVSWTGGGTGTVTVVPVPPFSADYRGGEVPCDALSLTPGKFTRALPRTLGRQALGAGGRLSLAVEADSPSFALGEALLGGQARLLERREARRRVLIPWAGGHVVGWIDDPGLAGGLGAGSLGTLGAGLGGQGHADPPTSFECDRDLPLYARTAGDAGAATSHVQVGTLLAGTRFEAALSPFMVRVRSLPGGVTPLGALEVPGAELFRCRRARGQGQRR